MARSTDTGAAEPSRPRRARSAAGSSKRAAAEAAKKAAAEEPARAASEAAKKAAAGAAQAADKAKAGVEQARASVEQVQRTAAEQAKAGVEQAKAGVEQAKAGVEQAQRKAAEETLPREVAVERGRPVVNLAIAGVVGFGLIFTIVRLKWSGRFDVAVTRGLQRVRLPGFDALMRFVSWPGFPPQSRAIPPIASGAMAVLGFPLEAAFQILSWGTGLVSTVTKALMKRPRPTEPEVRVVVAPLGGSSFPSGHVITYMGVYGFLGYLAHTLIRPAAIRRPLVGFFGGLVALVGPSRIYQGHHWATDVIASYLLGLSYLIGVTSVYRRLKGTLTPRISEPAGSARAQAAKAAEVAEVAGVAREINPGKGGPRRP